MEPITETHPQTPPALAPAEALRRLADVVWELPRSTRADMRVPARLFADEVLLAQIRRDRSLEQLLNVATLPGIVGAALGMPDMHEGYGFPVGGVAATLAPEGAISPGGIGFDINCGVRLLVSPLRAEEIAAQLAPLVHELSRSVPAGFGHASRELSLDALQMEHVLLEGVPWLVRALGFGAEEDLPSIESEGRLPWADLDGVSPRARERGHVQLGTLGGGNHFLEVQMIDRVFDEEAARRLGLFEGGVTVLIHTGSRGLGHQVCTDHVRLLDEAMPRLGLQLPDRQLACAPLSSREGRRYFSAMAAAANFGFCNRQVIGERTRRVFARFFGESGALRLLYDVAHNTAKLERHGEHLLCVHRKGATRALGPSSGILPRRYRGLGQPVLIPGSMGTASYVLLGTDLAEDVSFASCCHGAGRALSRGNARRQVAGHLLRKELERKGIVVRCASNSELAEEAPDAYKDVERVVDVVARAGIGRRVARLRPLGIIKG